MDTTWTSWEINTPRCFARQGPYVWVDNRAEALALHRTQKDLALPLPWKAGWPSTAGLQKIAALVPEPAAKKRGPHTKKAA